LWVFAPLGVWRTATVDINNLPKYRDLPLFEDDDERRAWGVFGPDDDLGTVNLLTEERVREAAQLVRTGKRLLDLPLDLPRRRPRGEGERGRGPYVHVRDEPPGRRRRPSR